MHQTTRAQHGSEVGEGEWDKAVDRYPWSVFRAKSHNFASLYKREHMRLPLSSRTAHQLVSFGLADDTGAEDRLRLGSS
jgi:hypothetical protein